MKKVLYTLASLALIAPSLSAKTISVDEAKANAGSFLSTGMRRAPALKGGLQLAGTMNSANQPTLYLFTGAEGKGLVVASASSLTMPVLGYSDMGSFDFDNMPESMKALLEDYSREIAMVEAGNVKEIAAPATPQRPAVEPIVKAKWNQNSPYNLLTPEMSGKHCMTGCVATAMAQVMRVFNWPEEHGEGFVSYNWTNGNTMLTYDLESSTLDWANMLYEYNSESTEAEQMAVAGLMRDCGYATQMQYSRGESGTTADKIPSALYYNFGYDANLHQIQRDYYTLSDWEQIVYDEVAAGRPVILTGVSMSSGGHCFVCDGYSSDRYFHINWGWGGMSDGYFLLTALKPSQQGIGGSTGGFNNYVNATVGIQKPVDGSTFYQEMLVEGNFGTANPTYSNSANVRFTSEAFYNPTFIEEKVYLGVKLTDDQGEVKYVRTKSTSSFVSWGMLPMYDLSGPQFPKSGEYVVTPAWCDPTTMEWHDMGVQLDKIKALKLTVDGNNLNFEPIAVDCNLEVKNIDMVSTIYTNAKFRIKADVVNTGTEEFLGEIFLTLLDSNSEVVTKTEGFNIDVEGNTTQPIEYDTKFSTAPNPGTYSLVYTNQDGKIISEPIEVDLTSVTTTSAIALSDLHFTSGDDASTPVVPSNDIKLAGTIMCTDGYYTGTLNAYVFPTRGGSSLGNIGAQTFFLHEGESEEFSMSGTFGNGEVGETYMICFFTGGKQQTGTLYFELGQEVDGLQSINAPAGVRFDITANMLSLKGIDKATIDVYSSEGKHIIRTQSTEVGISNLQPGAYIVIARTAQGPVVTKFAR